MVAFAAAMFAVCAALAIWSPSANASISLVGHASANTWSGGYSVSVAKPTGTRAGDVVVVGIQGASGTGMSVPSGWTALYNTAAPYGWAMLLYRVAGSSEPSSWSFLLPTYEEVTAEDSVWRGVDTANPIDAHAETGAYFWAWSTAPSVTTTSPNDAVVVGTTWDANVSSFLPSGVTQLDLVRSYSRLTSQSGWFTQATAGATPAKTFSASSYRSSGAGTFALQETNPPTLTGTSPASPANANTVDVQGSSQPGWTVRLYTNSTCTSSVAATGTGTQLASPGLAVTVADDSTTQFWATATDSYGQVSRCSSQPLTYVEDSTPPAAPSIIAAPASPGNTRAPSWSFTGEAGATFQCRLDRGATQVYDWSACSGTQSYDLTGHPDGTYTFSVRATDAAGNTGSAATSSYTLDTTPPAAPTISASPLSPGSGRSPVWSFSGEAGATFQCRLDRSGTQVYGWSTCTSPQSFDLSGQPDGAYTFSVRAIDAAGNTGSAATSGYTLDTTPPAAPTIVSAPASPGNGRTPSWSFSGEAGATFQCRLDRGATQVYDWGACSGAKSYDLTGQPDGTYTFSVRATDAAGNTGGSAASSYALDTTAPAAPTITSAPATPASGRSIAWSFTGEAGATFQCRLDRSGTQVYAWASCSGTQTYDLTGQPDGAYTFSVRATDSAGNTGTSGTSTYTLDTTAPAAPTIVSAPASPGKGLAPSWSFTSEPGASFQCRVDRGATQVYDWAACSSPQSFDLTGQPDGTYTLSVRATDAAGNQGAAATSDYVLDTTAPAAPTVTSAPSSPSSSRSPSWSFSAEPGATFQCRLDQTSGLGSPAVVSGWATCTSPTSYALIGQPDADYTLSVRAVDAAGNTGSAATSGYTLDTTGPAAPTIVAAPASPGQGRSPSWSFSGESGATFKCRLDRGSTQVYDWSACSGSQSFSLSGQLDDTYTFSVLAVDSAGNVGATATSDYRLDTTAPAAPTITSAPASPSPVATPSWSFGGETGASFQCKMAQGTTVISDWAACTSPASYDLSANTDGTYTFSVRAVDAAGNIGAATSSDYALDRTAPSVPTIQSSPPAVGSSRSPSWSFSGDPGNTLECRLDQGSTAVYTWAACTSPWTYDLTGQPDGDYTFSVREIDGAGNPSAPATGSYTLDTSAPAAPTIDTGPGSSGSNAHPSWSFSGEAGASFKCKLERGATLIDGWSSCSGSQGYDLSSQPDGGYTFSVEAIDAAGNTSPATTASYTLDTTPPAAPAITSAPASPGNGRSPSWSFSGEAGATFQCRLDGPSAQVADWASCSASQAYSLAGLADGTYTFAVRATDADGNTGLAASSSYTLDTAGPAAPTIIAAPASPGSGLSPSWSFSDETGASFQCRLDRGATQISAWAACSSPQGYSLAGQPDGTYTLSVYAIDTAGNAGATTTSDYQLDTTAPSAPTIDSEPTSPSAADSASWSFSGDSGASFQCKLSRGGVDVSSWTDCASPRAYDLTGEPDGDYTFSARALDAAGNVGPQTDSATYTRDTTPPAAPSIDSAPASPSAGRSPAWSFSGEPGASFECRLDRGSTQVFGWTSCSGTQGFSLTGQPDGAYTFSVRAIDAAGNTGSAATSGYTLDTTAPATPTIDSGPGAQGSSLKPVWSFSGDAGVTFECRVDSGAAQVQDWAACTSPDEVDLSGQPDGGYTFSVRAVDPAGNRSSAATSDYLLDTTAPAAPTITAAAGSPGNDTSPSWSFSGESGASFECRLDRNGTAVDDWGACATPKTYDLSSQPDATYTFSVRAVDTVGNIGPASSRTYTLDTQAPAAPTIGSSPTSPGNDLTPTWSASGETGSMLECRLDRGSTQLSDWAACPSPLSYDLTGEVDGDYTLSVRAVDAAGNRGPTITGDYQLDTTGPVAAISSAPASPGSARTASWAFSSEPGATFECRLEFTGSPTSWTPCPSPAVYDLSGQPDGSYTFSVRATDAVGNAGAAVASTYQLDTAAPGTPTIVAGPGAAGTNVTPAWSFTGDAGASFQCLLMRGDVTVSDWSSCPSPRGYDLTGQPDGTYTFEVRASDAAGNTGAAATSAYQLDTSQPGAPAVTAGPGPTGSSRTPSWSFTGPAGATFQCQLATGPAALSEWAPCTSPRTYELTGLPDASYTFSVRAVNSVGTPGPAATASYVLDTVAPAEPSFLSSPGALGRDPSPTWTFSGEAGASAQCKLVRRTATVFDWQSCSSPRTLDLSRQPDGTYTLSVRDVDAAGNVGAARSDDYQLDTTPPAAPTIQSDPGDSGTDRTPSWSFSGERDASFECRLTGGDARLSEWSSCKSPRSYDLSGQNPGTYTFGVRATDAAGNSGPSRTSSYSLVAVAASSGPTAPPPASGAPAPPAPGPVPIAPSAPSTAVSGQHAGSGRRGHARHHEHSGRPAGVRHAPLGPASARTPTVQPAAPARKEARKHHAHGAAGVAHAAAEHLRRVAVVLAKNADKGAFPGVLLLMVLGFVTIQGRMDRNDPKLALAPVFADPELEFDPPPDPAGEAG